MGVATAHPSRAPLLGRVQLPSDKSISHRAVMLAVVGEGTSRIENFSPAGDCRASTRLALSLGCALNLEAGTLTLTGIGMATAARVFPEPFDCGRSGTTMRLAAGLLAGYRFSVQLTGEAQLLGRPMERVAEPLRLMGAEVSTSPGGRPPLVLRGGGLTGISFTPPQASAQVKSAILLAGLQASSPTAISEPVPTRDHTERLLAAMGARVRVVDSGPARTVELEPGGLGSLQLRVPGDPSSAAVVATAAALVPGSDLLLQGVSVNPTRMGFFAVLARMGARVDFEPLTGPESPEPSADIRVRYGALGGFQVAASEVPALIDELPLLGLLAATAEGVSEVRGAAELRVKESDRIQGLVVGLRRLGVDAEELPDGFVVSGPAPLRGGSCDSRSDHRLAMTFTLAGLVSTAPVVVSGSAFVADSFPGFFELLGGLS